MSYYPYPNNRYPNSSYGYTYLPTPYPMPWPGCPSGFPTSSWVGPGGKVMRGITPCPHPGPDPANLLPPNWQTTSMATTYQQAIDKYQQNLALYTQYETERIRRIRAERAAKLAAAVQQKAKLDKALIKECKAGNQDACLQLKKMGFKGLAGISPFAYGAMPPASDEEKERNLQLFVGAMGLLLLGTLVFGAKGK